MALKTNYKDDILDTSVNEKRKFNMITNADGTVSFEDVTTYSQVGDSFGAGDINETNLAIEDVNANLTADNSQTFRFGYDAEKEQYGYYVTDSEGADTFNPFSNPYLKFDAENGGIFALDDTGEWTLIHKTDFLPICTFDGVLYNAGVFDENYFGSDYIVTLSGGGSFALSSSTITLSAYAPANTTRNVLVCMSTPIDVRRYNVLNISSKGSSSNAEGRASEVYFGIGASTNITNINSTSAKVYVGFSTSYTTKQIDVTDYDEVYLYFYLSQTGGSFEYHRIQYINKIWLTN